MTDRTVFRQTTMADRMTPEQRHHCMSSIRGRDTRPELAVRRSLFAEGFRYRLNVKALPGTPDIVLHRYHTVIFVNGCFWHGHKGCRHFVLPRTNRQFWEDKIRRNRRRDNAVYARLEALGWKIIVVWECELEKDAAVLKELPSRIRRLSAEYDKEASERRRLRNIRKEEKMAAAARHSRIEEEVSSRYRIPRSVVKVSEESD